MTDLNHMLSEVQRRVLRARRASLEERKELLFDGVEEVLYALLDNEGLSEDELLLLVQRKDLDPEFLRRLSMDLRVQSSYQVKRAILLNPKTPASVSLKFIGQLFTFDIMSVMLVPTLPREIKTAGEEILCRKYQQLQLGERITMARRTNSDRLLALMLEDNSREVVAAVLTNAFLREATVCAVLRKATTKQHTVELIALNAKWSCRYDIRYALLRTKHLTMGVAINFLQVLTAKDLRDLAGDPAVNIQIRTYIKSTMSKANQQKKLS
jgi:hypothetical protein